MLLWKRFLVYALAAAWSALAPTAAVVANDRPAAPAGSSASPVRGAPEPLDAVPFDKATLGEKFLLQVSYQQRGGSWRDFMTSRSRIVTFQRHDGAIQMIEDARDPGASAKPLATIPIRRETRDTLLLDFNAGFDKISNEEDRTGEDYYGRAAQGGGGDYVLRLDMQEIVRVVRLDSMLVLEQHALADKEPVSVYYYLSPYRMNTEFEPFELRNLDHFGFYETYPQQIGGRTVLYATKFDSRKPIVFALSSEIPARYREAVRDGVLYWNRALGRDLLQVVDAPAGVTAPNASYNVLQWVKDRSFASTSHIQADPLTGEILHAHIFLDARDLNGHDLATQNDHLRYLVAHEVGHALGLRHNFAKGPTTTVMNYFDFGASVALGRRIASDKQGLEYDRKVMRYVYLGEPLDLTSLPDFCTDSQPGCGPFPLRTRNSGG
jgi:hypothetical protein